MRTFLGLSQAVLLVHSPIVASAQTAGQDAPASATWGDTYRRRFEEVQKDRSAASASGCATSNCHRGNQPRPGEKFLGNEYDLWWNEGKGPHFRALKALSEDPRSGPMVRLLYGPDVVAQDEPRCRACHTLDVPPDLRAGQRFEERDGVSCENCHGRSQDWGSALHFSKQWRSQLTDDDRTRKGFFDTRDLVRRAEKCLECHFGTEHKQVTHEMLAAGHPPLAFELAFDLADVPKHWRDENSYLPSEQPAGFAARTWAVGQAVLLRESMYRIVNALSVSETPDFAILECYACHHELPTAKEPTWRQLRRVSPERSSSRPGDPVWEPSAWSLCQSLVDEFTAADRKSFDQSVERLDQSLRLRGGDRDAARTAAANLASLADALAHKVNAAPFDRGARVRVFRAVLRDREDLAAGGFRTAVQVYYAARALYPGIAAPPSGAESDSTPIHQTLAELEDLLLDKKTKQERPDRYDGLKFVDLLKRMETQLPRESP